MSGHTLLVIDDNAANMKLVCFVLEGRGYDLRTATNAEEALLGLRQFQAHLILMDLQLPAMDGLELTRRLKADPVHRDTIIVAVTASAMKGDEEKARAAGCDGYVTKPIDTRALPRIVASFLEKVPLRAIG